MTESVAPPSLEDIAYREHLNGCDACNYDKACIACEVGVPDGEVDGPDWHSCNCRHGKPTNGWHLRQKTTWSMRLAEEQAAREEWQTVINARANLAMMVMLGSIFVDEFREEDRLPFVEACIRALGEQRQVEIDRKEAARAQG